MKEPAQENRERWWLCWSSRQACLHIESEAEGLQTNIRAFQENRPVDYVPIAVFDNMEAASNFAGRLRGMMCQRHDQRVRVEEGRWN